MISRFFVLLIRGYQLLVSPFTRPSCRFIPSCSHYAIHAVQHYGVVKGLYLTCRRLFRCHPFSSKMGYDPVDSKTSINSPKGM